MRQKVSVTERDPALKTSLDSFQFSPSAAITGNITRSSIEVNRNSCIESIHYVSQQDVFLQHRSWSELLSALWTAEYASSISLVPVSLDALTAVAVSTGNTHWIPQEIQTDRTAELFLVHWLCHFTADCLENRLSSGLSRHGGRFFLDVGGV